MADPTRKHRTLPWLVLVVTGSVFLPTPLRALEDSRNATRPGPREPARVRASDARAATLLREGLARSATFRRLVRLMEASDLIVYVETRDLKFQGRLQLVAATDTCRYVRITIRTPGLDSEQIAALGHELWHAVELSRIPDVRTPAQLQAHYEDIGAARRYVMNAETAEAQHVGVKVLYEVRAAVADPRLASADPLARAPGSEVRVMSPTIRFTIPRDR